MKFPISKTKRLIYARKVKGFSEAFLSHKTGVTGLILIAGFVSIALLSPYLSPYDPYRLPQVAHVWAMPSWVTIFPGYEGLNPTLEYPLTWSITQNTDFVNVENLDNEFAITYDNRGIGVAPQVIESTLTYRYPYKPPPSFVFNAWFKAQGVNNTRYIIQFFVVTPNGKQFILSERNSTKIEKYAISISSPVPSRSDDSGFRINFVANNYDEYKILLSTDPRVLVSQEYRNARDFAMKFDPCAAIFETPGEYRFILRLTFKPRNPAERASANISIVTRQETVAKFHILGKVHGILGTDYRGRDVFTQIIAGARISLFIGILAAVLSVSMGIIVGVTAGYVSGYLDEALMRIVDILLCLPILPILLALVSIWGANVLYIVILIAIFGWQGLSRVIRSRVLSLKEMFFVESAKASGASTSYIVIRHIVPNVMPIAISALILSVPSAILTEATLSFIGFGDPTVPTWGRLLNEAQQTGAFSKLAWWVIFPPGIAISILCLGFILMGHSIDEILNPKLRRRR